MLQGVNSFTNHFEFFMAIRGIINKMAEGNEYLEYSDKSLECETKLWRPFLRVSKVSPCTHSKMAAT